MRSDSPLAMPLLAAARHASDAAEQCCRLLLERAAAAQSWRLALQKALARAGLTEAGFAVLAVLWWRRPEAMPRGAIAAAADLSKGGVADALLRLELSGLVARAKPGGRRAFWRLTAAGLRQIQVGLRCYVQAARSVTKQLSTAEIDAALAVAGKIRAGTAELERTVNRAA